MTNCDVEYIYRKILEIAKKSRCPLCGDPFYVHSEDRFGFRHVPFVEDNGDVVVGGIICGQKNAQRLMLLQCRKTWSTGGATRVYG